MTYKKNQKKINIKRQLFKLDILNTNLNKCKYN